jgi:hypothetical protein
LLLLLRPFHILLMLVVDLDLQVVVFFPVIFSSSVPKQRNWFKLLS